MNDKTENLPAKREARQFMEVTSDVALYDTSRFEHMQRVATVMAKSTLIPAGLRTNNFEETMGNCFLVVNQALHWQMDPFAVAQCMSVVHGKPCYEGKLIAAVLQGRMGVRLSYQWNDEEGDKFGITVTGKHPDDDEPVSVKGTVEDWKTLDKEKRVQKQWTGANARRQLAYRGAREWCRLYAPELLLGVYAIDEMQDARAGVVDTTGGPVIDVPSISAGFASKTPAEAAGEVQAPEASPEPTDAPEAPQDAAEPQSEPDPEPEGEPEAEPEPPAELELEGEEAPEADPDPDLEPEEPADDGADDDQAKREEAAADVMSQLILAFEKCEDWAAIKRCLAHVAKESPQAFAEAPAWLASKVRGAAFARGQDVQSDLNWDTDVTAYRCWLELVEDSEAIRDAWQELMDLEMFTKLAEDKREGLKVLTMDRIAFLEEGHDD